MFTVHNRDVYRLVSIAVFCCFLSPRTLHAQTSDIISVQTERALLTVRVPHDSYENYLSQRHIRAKKEKLAKKKPASITKRTANKKTSPVKKMAQQNKCVRMHRVKSGETLFSIARRYGATVEALAASNKLKNKHAIKIGMSLQIPATNRVRYSSSNKGASSHAFPKSKKSPRFRWPLFPVISYRNDGLDGVKSIGIIITGKKGSSVLSAAPGTVKKIGSMRGFGKYIVITHAERYSTVYSNLDRIDVSDGEKVPAGNPIGRINSSNQKLHFQIDLEGKPENPLKYLPGNM